MHSQDHDDSENVSHTVDHKGAKFIANKQIYSLTLTHRHSTLFISTDSTRSILSSFSVHVCMFYRVSVLDFSFIVHYWSFTVNDFVV